MICWPCHLPKFGGKNPKATSNVDSNKPPINLYEDKSTQECKHGSATVLGLQVQSPLEVNFSAIFILHFTDLFVTNQYKNARSANFV